MKTLNREECEKALESLKPMNLEEFKQCHYLSHVEANKILKQLIKEHFSPQPLKFEKIKAGMYVWDSVYESIGRVDRVLTNCNRRRLHNRYSGGGDIVDYEENRYYPIQIPIVGDNNEKHI